MEKPNTNTPNASVSGSAAGHGLGFWQKSVSPSTKSFANVSNRIRSANRAAHTWHHKRATRRFSEYIILNRPMELTEAEQREDQITKTYFKRLAVIKVSLIMNTIVLATLCAVLLHSFLILPRSSFARQELRKIMLGTGIYYAFRTEFVVLAGFFLMCWMLVMIQRPERKEWHFACQRIRWVIPLFALTYMLAAFLFFAIVFPKVNSDIERTFLDKFNKSLTAAENSTEAKWLEDDMFKIQDYHLCCGPKSPRDWKKHIDKFRRHQGRLCDPSKGISRFGNKPRRKDNTEELCSVPPTCWTTTLPTWKDENFFLRNVHKDGCIRKEQTTCDVVVYIFLIFLGIIVFTMYFTLGFLFWSIHRGQQQNANLHKQNDFEQCLQ